MKRTVTPLIGLMIVTTLLGLSGEGYGQLRSCGAGQEAFETHVTPHVEEQCSECHSGVAGIPPWWQGDGQQRYENVLVYALGGDSSTFVTQGGNSHCGTAQCNGANGAVLRQLVMDWMQGGQMSCGGDWEFTSPAVDASGAPAVDQPPLMLQVPLANAGLGFEQLELSLEAHLLGTQPDGRIALRLRRPRLVGSVASGQVVAIEDIFLLSQGSARVQRLPGVKGEYVADASGRFPLLAAGEAVLVLESVQQSQSLQVAVGDLGLVTATDRYCADPAGFRQVVWPTLARGNCLSCHEAAGGSEPQAQMTWPMTRDLTELCQGFSQRMQGEIPELSVAVAYAIDNLEPHPGTYSPAQVQRVYREWLRWWRSFP